jgi:K+-transporting ATPase ATPase C chain
MMSQVRAAIVTMLALTLLTGVVYPLGITAIAAVIFPGPAGGSLVTRDGVVVGSSLIAQGADDPGYLWPRPSAAAYDGGASSGSNLGPGSKPLLDAVAARSGALAVADPSHRTSIPVDLLTASGSGLDPHLSPEGAAWQVPRIAAARHVPEGQVQAVIDANTESRTLGFLGEPRVNVLAVNLQLGPP